jgi:uncharacterized protein (DUF1015 family)
VAAVPYDVVSDSEARTLASAEPLSFLHVSRAEVDLPRGTPPYSEAVYARAVTNMAALMRSAPLVTDESGAIYVYRLRMGAHEQTGVAGVFSIDEYERDVIRKHERTRTDKEDDRTRHIVALRAQTGPVFLMHRSSPRVRDRARDAAAGEPLFDFESGDGVHHTVWRAGRSASERLARAFEHVPALYIADGHHRAAAAARARRELGAAGSPEGFLAVAFADDEVRVLPYNRVVRDLGARTPDEVLAALRARLAVCDGGPSPARRGEVSMFLAGRWHTVTLPDAPPGTPPADRLDVSGLQRHVLEPLLGIADVRTDRRIDFVGGVRGTAALEEMVRSGRAAVAFSMFPVAAADIMEISDAGGIMPPKSTWFEPKLRDGLLIHVL